MAVHLSAPDLKPTALDDGRLMDRAAHGPTFDRATGSIVGATLLQTVLIHAFAVGAHVSAYWSYRGFGTICRVLRSALAPRQISVIMNNDSVFSFPFADSYWSALFDRSFSYEQDIEVFLRASRDVSYTLIDCGANYGYWSVLASGEPFGSQQVLAIEPSSHSFRQLTNNAAGNFSRFVCMKKAIGGHVGTARLAGTKHESMTIAGPETAVGGEEVPVITLDSLIEDGYVAADARCVVKLDVEGLEIDAVKGGGRLAGGDSIFICEDHGSDRTHGVSRYFLQNTPFKLFCFDPATGRFEHLRDVSSLDRIKRFRNRGYNVFATASAFWEQRLRAM